MSIPAGDDSDWADLASELGLETKPAPKTLFSEILAGFEAQQTPGEPLPFPAVPWPKDPCDPPAANSVNAVSEFADLPDAIELHDEQDTMLDPTLAHEEFAPDDGEGSECSDGSDGDGTPGTGKKRRRRRRRRKGGGTGGDQNAADAGDSEGIETDPEGEVEQVFPAEPRSTADAIRELVKNWNVPSWNEVVGGLYRPGGDR